MFKEQDDKGKTPYDLDHMCGEMGGDEYNPYDEETEAGREFSDGYYDATLNWNEEEDEED